MLSLTSEVRFLKGVGEARAQILEAKGIRTVEDLLYYVPRKYQDRRHPKTIGELVAGETATVVAPVLAAQSRKMRTGQSLFEVTLGSGFERLTCKWFNSAYLEKSLKPGLVLAVYGHIDQDKYSRGLAIMHPEHEIVHEGDSLAVGRIVPVYEAASTIKTSHFRGIIRKALDRLEPIDDPLPAAVREKLGLPSRHE